MLHEITPEEVNNCNSNTKLYSVPGMDGIPPKFDKLARCILSPYLAKLFYKCIEKEIFPRDFKVAYAVAAPRGGLGGNCPPTALSGHFCKSSKSDEKNLAVWGVTSSIIFGFLLNKVTKSIFFSQARLFYFNHL